MALTEAEIKRIKRQLQLAQERADRDAVDFSGRIERTKRESMLKNMGIKSDTEAAKYSDEDLKRALRLKSKHGQKKL